MSEPLNGEERGRRIKIVVEECDGILPNSEIFYLASIIYSADGCLAAFRGFQKSLLSDSTDPIALFKDIQETITHAGAVARYFWPSRRTPLSEARAKRLRTAFQIGEQSPLANRSLRNSIEHFDERIDDFLLQHMAGHFFPTPMVDNYSLCLLPTAKIFKLVDPINKKVVILNTVFDYQPIVDEVNRVYELATRMDNQGGRLMALTSI